jgi:hypothetical protein
MLPRRIAARITEDEHKGPRAPGCDCHPVQLLMCEVPLLGLRQGRQLDAVCRGHGEVLGAHGELEDRADQLVSLMHSGRTEALASKRTEPFVDRPVIHTCRSSYHTSCAFALPFKVFVPALRAYLGRIASDGQRYFAEQV